jgi:ABC-type branched-subunit amino acid transport system ATPase component
VKLELKGITKRVGSLVASDHIDVVVEPGQIHCLLGENGAGKSALVPAFTVAENVALGGESTKPGGVLDLDVTRPKIREISDRYGFGVDPDALLEDLPVGVQQRVEIIKAPVAPGGQHAVDGISFDIARGEILAVAGIQGNGQTELTEAILGLQDRVHGSILLDGDELLGRGVKDVLNAGVGIVPAGTDLDVPGLMMAGLSPEEAQADAAAKHHSAAAPAPTAQPVQEPSSGVTLGGAIAGIGGSFFTLVAIDSFIGTPVPGQFMAMLPYLVTVLAVAGLVGRSRPSAASGIPPYVKG